MSKPHENLLNFLYKKAGGFESEFLNVTERV